ncbi:MAG: MBL fold metallo-hydrolase [Deltaproteobacteria bacterium]|nr:MBL fold metallo-hydrolase [Deltaproteobacteria bacterium]
MLRLRILGSGTSTGVPLIGCTCSVCTSSEKRNKRLRSSAIIETGLENILIDTSPDLRTQALSNNIIKVSAVLFTHAHADHVHGIDDLRVFNMIQGTPIPCYGDVRTITKIREVFGYIFNKVEGGGWKPELTTTITESEKAFELFKLQITPIDLVHGREIITGFRVNNLAYVTDCSELPDASREALKGIKVLILGALRERPHPSHFSIGEAIQVAKDLGVERVILTHLGHKVDYGWQKSKLPKGVEFAYDGMAIDFE